MFDLLTRYLLENRKLLIPTVGMFELVEKKADADYAAESIAPPVWEAVFTENREVDTPDSEALVHWISSIAVITADEARQQFSTFTSELKQRLSKGEKVEWKSIGTLQELGGRISFTAHEDRLSPFTPVTAKKILRDEPANHETLVGHTLTTTSEMREKLRDRDLKRGRGNRVMWILLGGVLLATAWYFLQNGCNKQATGNRQPVEATAPGDTYKIQ